MFEYLYNYVPTLPSLETVTSYFTSSTGENNSEQELLSVNNIEPQVPISGITKISWLQSFSEAQQVTGSMLLSPIYITAGTSSDTWNLPAAADVLSAFGGPVAPGTDSQVQVGDVFGIPIVNNGDSATFSANSSTGGSGTTTVTAGTQKTIWLRITNIIPGSQSYELLNISN